MTGSTRGEKTMTSANVKRYSWTVTAMFLCVALVANVMWQRHVSANGEQTPKIDSQIAARADGLSEAFRQASDAVLPTVVKIKSTTHSKVTQLDNQAAPFHGENPFRGTPFEDFFSNRGGQSFRYFNSPSEPRRDGVGSGVIIDSSGVIVTNNHVVAGADTVRVALPDGREFDATEIHTDPSTDLAVLRIHGAGDLPAAALGDSDHLRVGDWVLAIGSPFELDATVSAGILSAKGRSLGAAERVSFLQTDAAVNPGNSGGPLVNLRGEVVGINTAIATNNGGYQGIGFAIPVNVVKWVSSELASKGKVDRSYLGVIVQPLTADLARSFGLPQETKGVLVASINPDTPAAKSGIQPGDVLTQFEDRAVAEPRELQDAVEHAHVGSTVDVKAYRAGKEMDFHVKLEALPDSLAAAAEENGEFTSPPGELSNAKLGLRVRELTAELAGQLGYGQGVRGVLIEDVNPDSVAYDSGLRPGMVIQRVGDMMVGGVPEFQKALSDQSLEKGMLLQVRTPEGSRFVVVKLR